MAKRRVMNYGPSTRTPRTSLSKVSRIRNPSRQGVFMRMTPGLDHSDTLKSELRQKQIKGMRSPGIQPRNYQSPNA